MEKQVTFGDLRLTRTGHFSFTSADHQKWLIQNVWANQGTGMISGVPKVGKTYLVQEVAVCVATGLPFLDKFPVHAHGPVIFSSPEGSPRELDERFRQICKNKKIDQKDLDLYIVTKHRLHLNNPHDQDVLRKAAAQIKPALIVYDPFKNHFNGNENDTSAVSVVTNFLTSLSNEFGCAIILTHHQVKANSRSDGQSIRGSGALFGFGDSYLFLKKDKRGRIVLSNEQRHAAPMPPLQLKLKASGGFVIDTADRTEKKVDLDDRIRALMKALPTKRWTVDMLRKKLGGSNSEYSGALALLVRLGLIHKHPKSGFCIEKPKEKSKKQARPSDSASKAHSRTDEVKTG